MPFSYEAKLRRDLRTWEQDGLIDAAQRERIEQRTFGQGRSGALQAALFLGVTILLAAATCAFVAANWAALAATTRMGILLGANAAAVALTYWLSLEGAEDRTSGRALAIDAAATLSLGLAALSTALVAQTFHLPSDPRGFARTVAALGLVTALVTRSRGATLVGLLALIAATVSLPLVGWWGAGNDHAVAFWCLASAYLAAALVGALPAPTTALFLGLLAVTLKLAGTLLVFLALGVEAELVFAVALSAIAAGQILTRAELAGSRFERLHAGGMALTHAAAGLCLLAILAASWRAIGWGGRPDLILTWPALAALAALAAALAVEFLPWRGWRQRVPRSDVLVLGAAAASLLLLVLGARIGIAARGASPFWAVWIGIVPTLAIAMAAHLERRATLRAWAMALSVAQIGGLLFLSGNLIAFAANLLASALLVALAAALCRWLGSRPAGASS